MKPWLLRLHRWAALVFALPLFFVLGSGLVLSFEPWLVVRAIAPNTLNVERVETLLKQHDAAGQATAITYRSYDNTLTLGRGRGGKIVDAATGEAKPGPSPLASTLQTMRRLHETLLYDLRWLVIACTFAMLVLACLGVLMGLPRISNSLSGWHKAMAWGLLPLIVLSPLTGLFIFYRITFMGAPAAPAARGAPLSLLEAVRVVGRERDLSSLIWLRPMGGRTTVRLVENGEYRVYTVGAEGLTAVQRNWPRLLHEGNFAGVWSSLMNIVTSLAMLGLLVTGIWIWGRRQLRRRSRAQARSPGHGVATSRP